MILAAKTLGPPRRHSRLAEPLLLGAGVCVVVALVFVGFGVTNWQDDVDIIGGRFDGTVCAWSVYGAMTAAPRYGPSQGADGGALKRDPAYEAACTEAARPAWEAGRTQMRVAVASMIVAVALSLAAGIVWFGAARREPESG